MVRTGLEKYKRCHQKKVREQPKGSSLTFLYKNNWINIMSQELLL